MRLVQILVTLVLLSLLPAGTAGAHPAAGADDGDRARQQRVRVELSTATPWVRKGGIATLNGRVRGVRGRTTVTLLQRTAGKRVWHLETRKRTSRKGYFKHREDIRSGSRDYKACVKGRCSKAVRVRMGTPPSRPTAISVGTLSVYTVEAGQAFTVQGTAVNLDGYSVDIQGYDGGSSAWSSIGNAHVSNGSWSASVSLSTAGKSVPVRAVFAGVPGRKPSVSNSAALAVYGWYYFYDGTPESTSYAGTGSYDVNGVNYSKSLYLSGYPGDTYYEEFNLSRSCLRLRATVGLEDGASTQTRTTSRIITDSVTKWTQAGIALGQSHSVDLDVSNALRLRIENTETTSGSGYLVYGDARALCAF